MSALWMTHLQFGRRLQYSYATVNNFLQINISGHATTIFPVPLPIPRLALTLCFVPFPCEAAHLSQPIPEREGLCATERGVETRAGFEYSYIGQMTEYLRICGLGMDQSARYCGSRAASCVVLSVFTAERGAGRRDRGGWSDPQAEARVDRQDRDHLRWRRG